MSNITFSSSPDFNNQAIVVLINDQLVLDEQVLLLDQHYHGIISKTLQNKLVFDGRFGQHKILTSTNKNGDFKYIVLMGIGDTKKLENYMFEQLGGLIYQSLNSCKVESANIIMPSHTEASLLEAAASVGSGMVLASYRFDKYKTKLKSEDKSQVENLEIFTREPEGAQKIFQEKSSIISGIFLARDCISEPANVLYPESYSQIIVDELEPHDVDVEVHGEREMRNFGMGALLGVGQGSQNESKLVVMIYNGGIKGEAPVALVGKGVTFDTGGISLKPSLNMGDMKCDMAGSAAVVGCIKALAHRKAKVNVVGVIGLVENMPGGNAQRPGDIVTTMSGQTAEVLDTDAEGRLVLADAIWYAQDKFKPKCVIDLATLTGAIVVALGNSFAGLFSNSDDLSNKLLKAGAHVDEKLWRMPLHKDFDEMIKSDIADVANLGNVRGAAGSSTAAHFIGRFIKEGVDWAHLDIAGMAWEKKGSATSPKGAVGFGIKLLNQFILDNYEG